MLLCCESLESGVPAEFTRGQVVETYIEFINNWKAARDAIKAISAAKPAFAKFLEHTSREHKGKLTLDALLIMPVQRIPRYELLIKELLKHTPMDHPDHKLLLQAQKEVHDLAVKINKVEREALQQEQRLQKLREVEQHIEGIADLTQGNRNFIRYDFVLIPGGLGMKKERCLFLFSDMLLITSIKRKGGAIRKTSIAVTASTCASLESNKYKLLMRTPLHCVDLVKTDVDEPCVRTFLKEVASLESDITTLGKILEFLGSLNCEHQLLEDTLRDLLANVTKQLSEKQASCSQLMTLDLVLTINDDVENITLMFPNPEQRMTWEAAFLDAKEKSDHVSEKVEAPEFLCSIPLRKTRAGLQVTCAAAVVDSCQNGLPDLWICSSDGYVGQVSVLTFQNEPVITSSVNICNARILCIAAVPGVNSGSLLVRRRSTLFPYLPGFKYERLGKGDKDQGKSKSFPLDSDSEDEFIDATDDFASDDANTLQPTMWLGTEDGWHVNGRVFVSLANGEIVIYSRDQNEFITLDDDNVCTAPIMADKHILEFVQSSNNIIDADSEDKNEMNIAAPVPISSEMRNVINFIPTVLLGGLWNTGSPHQFQIATNFSPISKMILIGEKLWCSTLNSIVIIDTISLEIENTFHVVSDIVRHITAIVYSEQGVWITVQSSPVIYLYHPTSYEHLLELNISSPVTKMLSAYDEIIKQHKLACLRVSSICVEKNLLWIGTSAGVVLNLPLPNITSALSTEVVPNIIGMPHGHFGHVRFLTSICATLSKDSPAQDEPSTSYDDSYKPSGSQDLSNADQYSAIIISGGDGYEDFGNIISMDTAGRDDSTNHLLMWRV
ncbi:rho guanine nucleotide exchange factor 17 [Trichonephila clavipes]|nr:rho guanine nucleotide exchange factor 17 [Trichonephila clavipes]